MILFIVLCLMTGGVIGFLSGFLGIGGGLVIIPILHILFHYLVPSIPSHEVTYFVIGTSLATMIVTGFSAFLKHSALQNIDKRIGYIMVLFVIPGSLLGSYTAHYIDGRILTILFIIFLTYSAINMLFFKNAHMKGTVMHEEQQKRLSLVTIGCCGFGIGLLSSLIGIGGGVPFVAFLSINGMPIRKTIGTSSMLVTVVSVMGATGYVLSGLKEHLQVQYSLGYVYLPAFFAIALATLFTSRMGAAAITKIPMIKMRRTFGGFLAIAVVSMVHGLGLF